MGGRLLRKRVSNAGAAPAAGNVEYTYSSDFLLAATYQDSAPASGNRATEPSNYCDK